MFACADPLDQTLAGGAQYWESLGLPDAEQAQTILACERDDQTVPAA
ncbi:hypothetical protein [Kaistia granuli]|nr:hypothetical protein [Kaistia granuli]